jgi:membrane associated rhomboid family serine protease
MSFSSPSFPRLTPWVGRLIAVTAVAQLLLETIFVSPNVQYLLQLNPMAISAMPWGVVTYLFVHGGIIHLATNMFALYVFGPAVENRLGSRTFILYYLYCGIGAALFSVLLGLAIHQSPVIGASGAVLGVLAAYAMLWPDEEVFLLLLPIRVKARTLVIALAVMDLVLARFFPGSTAHEAHLGGLLAGWLFFKAQNFSRRRPTRAPRQTPERVVMVQQTASRESEPRATAPARPMQSRPGNDPVAAEVDRVLDKISATGIESLTPDERRFLDEVSKRKKREIN